MHVVNAFTGCQDEARINAGTSSKPARHGKLYVPFLEMTEYVNFLFSFKTCDLINFSKLKHVSLRKNFFL